MDKNWSYQLRINVSSGFAREMNNKINSEKIIELNEILDKFNASVVSQYKAFKSYVEEAETIGVEKYPLYKWTKATIEDNNKKEKYLKSYTVSVNGHDIYEKKIADSLEVSLANLIDKKDILSLSKHDTNPKNNPQIPKKYI